MNTRLISIALCVAMFFGLPVTTAVESAPTTIPTADFTVVAASDFQPQSSFDEGVTHVENIISAIKADGITAADGFLFCGDYDAHTYGVADKTRAGIQMFKDSFKGMIDEENMFFAQGNHDASPAAGVGLSPSGDNDPESGDYGVFVIHNEDYMWANKDEERIKQTAQKLIIYLNEKLAEEFVNPVFVVAHLPLHYTMRTRNDGDGKYAGYIFEALQEAAEKGLNIVYLYGHDHSNGWDDYLGGSSVYLAKGDDMLVADYSSSKYSYKTLNFTYMSAGFTGYYDNHNGADDTLTMTVFQVKDGVMSISRYDGEGVHVLKSEGFTNAYKNETGYLPNKTVYESPQRVTLTKVTDSTPIDDLLEIPDEGRGYKLVSSLSEIAVGEKYLLVCGRASNKIMLPSVVTKSNSSGARIGFDLTDESVYVDDVVYGDYADMLWTFTKKDDKWLIGNGEGFAKFTSTSSSKVTATIETSGDAFTIVQSGSTFTFTSGSYCLNYNSRGLVNGYEGDPAEFYIFKCVGYSVSADGGEVTVDGERADAATTGKTVTVRLESIPEGKRFDCWKLISGGVEIEDLTASEITFVMKDENVKLLATYKDVILGDVNDDGKVTNADVLCICRCVFNPVLYPVPLDAGDVNCDGRITNADVLLIFRYIFSPENYPLG